MAPKLPLAGRRPVRLDFSDLSRERLEAMREAGERVRECCRVLAKTEDNVVGEVLRGQGTFYEWDHYPKGDVYDPETHAQYYYHAHPAELRGGEHGHFHCFLRPGGMPNGVRPAPLPDYTPPKDPDDALSHLVAISMDRAGFPIRLFTTNRWVTGEAWYRAADVTRMLDRFVIDLARPSWATNIWITAMLRLFRPQIEQLLHLRDRTVAAWQESHPDANVFEDRALEITSVMEISVDDQIAAVRRALRSCAA
ncbi:MAG: hypothetical protein ACE5ED_04615 [Rhodothalassiaceae bacterium]